MISPNGGTMMSGAGVKQVREKIQAEFEKALSVHQTQQQAIAAVAEAVAIVVIEEKPLPLLEERAERHVKSAMLRVPPRLINPRQVRYYVNGDAKEDADTLIRQALRRLR
jgi:hypothetical protein